MLEVKDFLRTWSQVPGHYSDLVKYLHQSLFWYLHSRVNILQKHRNSSGDLSLETINSTGSVKCDFDYLPHMFRFGIPLHIMLAHIHLLRVYPLMYKLYRNYQIYTNSSDNKKAAICKYLPLLHQYLSVYLYQSL